MLNLFQSAIVTVLFPKAAGPVEEVVTLIGRAVRVSMALSLLTSIAVMIVGPVVLRLLYGPEFIGAVPVPHPCYRKADWRYSLGFGTSVHHGIGATWNGHDFAGHWLGPERTHYAVLIPIYGMEVQA